MVAKQIPPQQIRFVGDEQTIVFKPPELSQAKAIAAAVEVSRDSLLPFMPWAHGDCGEESQRQRLASAIGSYWDGQDMVYTMWSDAGVLLGSVGLHPRVPLNPSGTEIGYWVHSEFQGRGLATLATQVLVLVGFRWFGFDRLQISHLEPNAASRRVIEKVGFQFEGRARNWESPRTAAELNGGLNPCRNNLTYALIPEDLAALQWVEKIALAISIEDCVGVECHL